jgi:heat-inducible transcriptional repressor
MTAPDDLSERELRVLEAVVRTYVETAEPAGSQAVVRRSGLGVSSATVRSTMSDLEEKGYLYHPHTSAGRIPTDRGYRTYVDGLLRVRPPSGEERARLRRELEAGAPPAGAIDDILRRAAQVLGVLTQELGVAVSPAFDRVVLERLDLVPVGTDRMLIVFNLLSGAVRTIFVQVPASIGPDSVQPVNQILNERLAGLSLQEIRATLPERLRDAAPRGGERDLLNIFIAQGDALFDLRDEPPGVMLGSARLLADQPEFSSSNARMRELLELTEERQTLAAALESRRQQGVSISIGGEHADPRLAGFTLVTSSYRTGSSVGVIGVIGPTRMPYDKIVSLVDHTSRLVEDLLT